MSIEPIPIRVLRHKCPHCGRTHSRPGRAREHMARCWHNPEAKGCKTCKHYEPAESDGPDWTIGYGGHYEPEGCAVGVDLRGRLACQGCGGFGEAVNSAGASVPCTANHIGDGREVKPGPIVGCEKWEADPNAAPAHPARLASGETTP